MKFNSTILLAALLLVSCARREKTEERIGDFGVDHSCAVPVDQGDAFSRSMVRASVNRPALVAKAYDETFFEFAERLSGRGLAELSTSRNVKLSKANQARLGACLQYSFLPAAPPDVQAEWDRISRRNSGAKSKLLGVFFPEGRPQMPSAASVSYVAVPADTTKWTVFHELMHNEFFQTERVRRGYMDPHQNQFAFGAAERRLAPYLADIPAYPERSEIPNLALEAVRYANGARRLIRDYFLEEVTIETMLLRSYNRGRFLNAADETDSAASYIVSSMKNAQALRDSTQRLLDRMRLWSGVEADRIREVEAVLNGDVDSDSGLPSMNAMIFEAGSAALVALRENESRRGYNASRLSLENLALSYIHKAEGHRGCSHSLPDVFIHQ